MVITPLKLADGLWMLTGAGGNLLVCAGPDGALLVDAQYGPLAAKIRAVVDSLSGGRPLRFVLNTHYHGDHVGGDSAMAAAGATDRGPPNVRRRMSVDRFNETFGTTTKAAPARALPVLTFSDSLTFHLGGPDIHVFHLPPGHTDGDAVVWVPAADVLHTGDLLFNGTYPVIDVSAGGSIGGMIRSLDLLLPLVGPATKIVPGHGPLADRAALLRFRGMLVTVRDRVAKLVKEGRTLEQVKAAKPLADLDEAWGQGFMKPDSFLGVVYTDLARSEAGGEGGALRPAGMRAFLLLLPAGLSALVLGAHFLRRGDLGPGRRLPGAPRAALRAPAVGCAPRATRAARGRVRVVAHAGGTAPRAPRRGRAVGAPGRDPRRGGAAGAAGRGALRDPQAQGALPRPPAGRTDSGSPLSG